jgi:hypothetical protein
LKESIKESIQAESGSPGEAAGTGSGGDHEQTETKDGETQWREEGAGAPVGQITA